MALDLWLKLPSLWSSTSQVSTHIKNIYYRSKSRVRMTNLPLKYWIHNLFLAIHNALGKFITLTPKTTDLLASTISNTCIYTDLSKVFLKKKCVGVQELQLHTSVGLRTYCFPFPVLFCFELGNSVASSPKANASQAKRQRDHNPTRWKDLVEPIKDQEDFQSVATANNSAPPQDRINDAFDSMGFKETL